MRISQDPAKNPLPPARSPPLLANPGLLPALLPLLVDIVNLNNFVSALMLSCMCCLVSIFYERAIPSQDNLFPDTTNLLTRARLQARNEGHLAAFLTACSKSKHFRQSRKTFGKEKSVYYLYPIIQGFVKQTSGVKGSASLLPLSFL
jgi:hypothetical protein